MPAEPGASIESRLPAESGASIESRVPTALSPSAQGNAAIGAGVWSLNYIPWNTYNYMADVDEIVTGRRREGVFAGVMTFIRKTAQAGAVALAGVLLEAGGFLSGSKEQSSGAVNAIIWLLAAGPLVVLALGFLVSLRFKLSAGTRGADERDRARQGG